MTAIVTTQTDLTSRAHPRRWQALFVLLAANFMNLLDVTIINVALPSIQGTTGAGVAALQWIVAGYLLVFALALLPGGRLGDRYGHKQVFLAGVGLFTLASVLCGLATTSEMLVAGRLLQGAGAALMVPQVLAIVHVTFPADERAMAFGLAGAVSGLAVIVGPLLGGGLITLDLGGLGWRWIFLVNIPVGVYAMVRGAAVIPASVAGNRERMDWFGTALATVALLLILYPMIEGSEIGWSPTLLATIASAIPLLALFLFLQRRREARGGQPLVPSRLLRYRSYGIGLALAWAFFAGVAGFFMVFAVYLQNARGFSAMQTGLGLLPFALGAFAASAASAMRKRQASRSALAAGTAIMAIGVAGLQLALSGMATAYWYPAMLTAMALAGIGMGIFVVNMFDAALGEVSPGDAGVASGLLHTKQQLGNASGVALVGAIFFGTLSSGDAGSWETAISRALWYEILLYTACTVLALQMPARATRDGRHHATA